MKIKLFSFIAFTLLVSYISVNAQENDKLLQVLKQELQYSEKELTKQDLPPYYINFRVIDDHTINLVSSFGVNVHENDNHSRMFVPQIRLGNFELDNFKLSPMGIGRENGYAGSFLPLEDEGTEAIRQAIWREMLRRYEFARNMYNQTTMRASVSVEGEDKSPCFSAAPVEKYYEEPLSEDLRQFDKEAWKERLNEISAVFKNSPELKSGSVSLNRQILRTYFINTDGSEVVQNRCYARIIINATGKAEDGMELPLNYDFFAYSPEDLPSNEVIIGVAEGLIKKIDQLKNAPVVDPYTGPAILSGPASGVFFHEIFGHRLESHRLKQGGETFKKMVGERVLPEDFQVYSDPTLQHYADTWMNGHYYYDDEGVKARRVDNIVNGVLKEFLLGRMPIEGFPFSNAHGRTSGGSDPVTRQSNLIVETNNPYTEAELRQMLIEEAKNQGKDYGYFFKAVSGGFTLTGDGNSLNSFNVNPVEVYRIYVDGRPDQLVRGVDLIGTPLSMFSNIAAGGAEVEVFTGMCGAESGWVPVTACSPMIFVTKIETQRRAQSRELPPILPAPISSN